jgi:hypothetical protein
MIDYLNDFFLFLISIFILSNNNNKIVILCNLYSAENNVLGINSYQ